MGPSSSRQVAPALGAVFAATPGDGRVAGKDLGAGHDFGGDDFGHEVAAAALGRYSSSRSAFEPSAIAMIEAGVLRLGRIVRALDRATFEGAGSVALA